MNRLWEGWRLWHDEIENRDPDANKPGKGTPASRRKFREFAEQANNKST